MEPSVRGLRTCFHEQVYPPSEDTFLLISCVGDLKGKRVLEVGSGSGLISVFLSEANEVYSTDINPFAVEITKCTSKINQRDLEVIQCDLASCLRGSFDVILFNPPYLPFLEYDKLWEGSWWSGGKGGIEVTLEFLKWCSENAFKSKIFFIYSTLSDEEALFKGINDLGFLVIKREGKSVGLETIYCLEVEKRAEDNTSIA